MAGDAEASWPTPDLVIIDGGKGQLSAACKALDALGITAQPIISLAKQFEEVYRPGISQPMVLPRDSDTLFLLQQLRDEAHRFAITYHRALRGKHSKTSALDAIPGVGPKRRITLLKAFGSIKAIRSAEVEALHTRGGLPLAIAEARLPCAAFGRIALTF